MQKTSTITTTDQRVAEIRAEVPEGKIQREHITIADVVDFIDLCSKASLPLDTPVVTDSPFTGFVPLSRLHAKADVIVSAV